jgi:hypothetical protein
MPEVGLSLFVDKSQGQQKLENPNSSAAGSQAESAGSGPSNNSQGEGALQDISQDHILEFLTQLENKRDIESGNDIHL